MGAIPIIGLTYATLKDPKESLTEFNESPIGLAFIFVLMLFFFGYFCYKYFFDNKIKLVIDKQGIWTAKHGQIAWQSIWYIYQREIRGKYTEQRLIIRLGEDGEEIKLNTTNYNKTADEIMEVIKSYSQKFNIQILDKEIQ